MQKAIIYTRVSTQKQVATGYGLEAQMRICKEFCDYKKYVVIDVFTDEGLSGKSIDNRPALMDAVAAAIRESAILVSYTLSRVGRNALDLLELSRRIEVGGASLAFVKEEIDLSTPTGKMMFTVLAAVAQLERDQVSERTKDAMAHADYEGRRGPGKLAYGEGDGEGRIVTAIMDRKQRGLTLQRIAEELNKAGLRMRNGKEWYSQSVASVI